MKKLVLALAAVTMLSTPCFAGGSRHGGSYSSHSSSSTHSVRSYVRKDGTFVHSYRATNPNSTRNDNFSTRGNVNPYTGRAGTKPRDGEGN